MDYIVRISREDADFPKALLLIGDDCPDCIYCMGNLDLLKEEKTVAIIGARSADAEGCRKAYELGAYYARRGYVVVSGLALGCDTSAHQGCLSVGGGTIAIVGNGLDIIHPKANALLTRQILDSGGLVLSEWPAGVKANPTRLVARCRLQAALAQTVILTQCPQKSGSMHTMQFARKYGKTCHAATYPQRTEANAGNYHLLDHHLATPLIIPTED